METEKYGQIFNKQFFLDILQHGQFSKELLSYKISPGSKPGENYSSLIFSVALEFKNQKNEHWIIKCYPNHKKRQEFGNKTNMFHKELTIYSEWIKELKKLQFEILGANSEQLKVVKLPFCQFIGGQCIDYESDEGKSRITDKFHSLDNYIILQDLVKSFGFILPDRRKMLDLTHIKMLIEAVAKIHATSWAVQFRSKSDQELISKFLCLRSLYDMAPETGSMFRDIVAQNLDLIIYFIEEEFGPGNALTASVKNFKANVNEHTSKFFAAGYGENDLEQYHRVRPDPSKFENGVDTKESWRVFIHGDVWPNNMLFRYKDKNQKQPEEIVLVDLQMVKKATIIHDLIYIFYLCADTSFRKQHSEELLQLYHDSFVKFCTLLKTPTLPGFSLNSLKYRLHVGGIMGYYMSVMGLPTILKESAAHDLENESEEMDLQDMIQKVNEGAGNEGNFELKKRLIETTKEFYDAGVI